MTTLIGVEHAERHACTDEVHLVNCFNPSSNLTACACGDRWWVGQVGTWHSRQLRGVGHETATGRFVAGGVIGWDRYFLHVSGCSDERVEPEPDHVCGGSEPLAYADAVRAAREGRAS